MEKKWQVGTVALRISGLWWENWQVFGSVLRVRVITDGRLTSFGGFSVHVLLLYGDGFPYRRSALVRKESFVYSRLVCLERILHLYIILTFSSQFPPLSSLPHPTPPPPPSMDQLPFKNAFKASHWGCSYLSIYMHMYNDILLSWLSLCVAAAGLKHASATFSFFWQFC